MTKAMKHPADHDPDRFFYVLFVEGKGYVSNYLAWRTGKEFLQFEEKVERASFWDSEDAVILDMAALYDRNALKRGSSQPHYTRRNSKGVEDLDKNPVPSPPDTMPGGWFTVTVLT